MHGTNCGCYAVEYILTGTSRSNRASLQDLVVNLRFSDRWDMLVKLNDEVENKDNMAKFRKSMLPDFLYDENNMVRSKIELPKSHYDTVFKQKWEEHFWIKLEVEVRGK